MLFLQGHADWHWWVFFLCVTAFWPFPLVLRLTGWYVPLALISIQNLILCIIWGCYFYGGISSPILPWFITIPLLAFFYLPTSRTRIMVSVVIVANLVGFYFIYTSLGFPSETIVQSSLVALGIVSTLCAGIYVSMMALYYASIVSSQSELEEEVQRHQKTERELRDATVQVERATKAKSEFLAKMSHELRNPLNAIIGYTELLVEDSAATDDQTADDLKSIKVAAFRLLELVNDLLDLSKLEAGKMQLGLERFSIAGMVEDLAAKWREKVELQGNALRVHCQFGNEQMTGDAAKMHQAASNLLANAAKFTRDGTVTLTAARDHNNLVLMVEDTGPGIAPEQIGGLFETFGNRSNETSSNYGEDPGLGLPLTYRLCVLMDGRLTVDSELGRGSRFTIRVPIEGAAAEAGHESMPAMAALAPA
jgi:signal transduction histidine kinase